ncbi:MAG: class I SAM-dependent methyltransferase, partial [Thermoleophilaceae bacterium]
MADERMRRFWDERAREDAFFFVDSRRAYGDPGSKEFWGFGEEAVEFMLDDLDVELAREDDVVEIGCGIGRMTRPLARRARRVRALDVAPEMLRLAQEHNEALDNVEWLLGDGVSLAGIADESADACLSTVVFQHIPDPEITLGYVREVGRILRPGGWAALQVSNDPGLHRRHARPGLRSRLAGVLGRGPRGQANPAWVGSAVDLAELERAAGEARMALERTSGAGTQYC